MDRLGEYEIFCIYERITKRVDKRSFSAVSKKFLKVASFHLRSIRTKFPDLIFDILDASPKLFSFECHKPFSNNHMKLIAKSCQNLEQLNISKRYYIDHEMDRLDFDDVGLCSIANACIHLVDVNLDRRLNFKEKGIGSLVRSCKNLRILSLNYCVNVTDRSLKMIGEATCIEKLYLHNCGVHITDYGVVALCELPNLKILTLEFLTNITDISLLEIGRKCLKMIVLSLEGCNRITGVGLHAFYSHQTLFELILVSCYKLSFEDVKPIVMSCPNLRLVYLSRSMKKPMPEALWESFNRCQIYWKY